MEEIVVHPRIVERHPELSKEDVLDAWESCIRSVSRVGGDAIEYIAIGVNIHGRLVEMVARATSADTWAIYHAFTPPTKKALRELGMTRR